MTVEGKFDIDNTSCIINNCLILLSPVCYWVNVKPINLYTGTFVHLS